MGWDWFKRKLGSSTPPKTVTSTNLPEVRWLQASDNPWGVPVLDVRPITLSWISMSENQQSADNALSYSGDDGLGFVGVNPSSTRQCAASLQYRIDKTLVDGALFIPNCMEHKWALYLHCGKIICIRSWLRSVEAIAETRMIDGR